MLTCAQAGALLAAVDDMLSGCGLSSFTMPNWAPPPAPTHSSAESGSTRSSAAVHCDSLKPDGALATNNRYYSAHGMYLRTAIIG